MNVRKQALTLLEIMIVIFLIGILGSVLSYTMKGSLNEGRAFKSERGSKQIHELLTLKMAEGIPLETILEKPKFFLEQSGFVDNPDKTFKDGWNRDYELKQISEDDFIVYSPNWEKFLIQKKKQDRDTMQHEYPWAFRFYEEEIIHTD